MSRWNEQSAKERRGWFKYCCVSTNMGLSALNTFEELPRIGDTINLRQMNKSTFFEIVVVEHLVTDPTKPADVAITAKRVVKWPG